MMMNDQQRANFAQRVPIVIGSLLVLVIGALVEFGWFSGNKHLIQIHPSFVPMQFNTALCFILCAVSYLNFSIGRILLTRIFSCAALIISSLTLLQYISGADFGIDQLFIEHYVTTKTSHPGRMAPNTALCFILSSVLILLRSFPDPKQKNEKWLWTLNCLVIALSLVSLIGYLTDLEATYAWQKYTQMAVHTASAFFILSLGHFINLAKTHREVFGHRWLPVPLATGVFVVFVMLAQGVKQREVKINKLEIDHRVKIYTYEFEHYFSEALVALKRLSSRITYVDSLNKNFWLKDTTEYLQDFPFYNGIFRVDTKNKVQWRNIRNKNISSLSLMQPEILYAAKKSRETRDLRMTGIVNFNEKIGFAIIIPIYKKTNTYFGSTIAIVDTEILFKRLFAELGEENFLVHLEESGAVVYDQFAGNEITNTSLDYLHEKTIGWENLNWTLKLVPKDKILQQSWHSELLILLGFFIAVLVGAVIMLWQSVRKKTERNTLFLEGIGVGIWDWIDTDKNDEFWSNRFYNLIGYDRNELASSLKSFEKLLHPDDKDLTFAKLKAHFEHNAPFTIEYRLKHKTEGYRWFRGTGAAQRSRSGRPIRMIGSIEDIHDRKVLQQESESQKKLLDLVFQNMHEGITVVDKDFNVVLYNEAGRLITGIDSHEADLSKWSKQFGTFCADRVTEFPKEQYPLVKALKGEKVSDVHMFLRNPNIPEGKYIDCSAFPIHDEEGNVVTAAVFFRDITKSLTHSKELEKVNSELEQFTYVVSHDLKAPLVSINGFASRLLAKPENLTEKQIRYLQRIEANIKIMGGLLADLLELSKTRRLGISKDQVKISDIIDKVKESLAGTIESSGAKIILADDLHDLYCDSSRIFQVFSNLINNSIKYCKPDIAPEIHISTETTGDYTECIIKDNGVGIPKEYLDRVFKIFERLDPQATEGTGLGLSIVQSVIEKHEGEIWVNSEVGRGSKFHFVLPIKKKNEEI